MLTAIHEELLKLEKLDCSATKIQTLKEAFISNQDVGIMKESPINNRINRRGMELFFGFYSDVDVSFDMHYQNKFYAHYDLKKGIFYPLDKKNDKFIVIPLIDLPYMETDSTFITNVSTDIYAPDKLFLVGAVLKHETYRKEIVTEPYFNKDFLEI